MPKHKDLPFQPWGRKAIAEGRKVLTSRCSGLAAVNKNPDEWEYGGENIHGQHIFYNKKDGLLIRCPWQVGVDYDGVTVTGITAKRVQDMTPAEVFDEGLSAEQCWTVDEVYCGKEYGRCTPMAGFKKIWDSIHRRDVNNRYERNPWTWRLSIKRT